LKLKEEKSVLISIVITNGRPIASVEAVDHDTIDKKAPVLKNTKAVQMMIVGAKRSGKSTLILSLLFSDEVAEELFSQYRGMISPSSSDGKMTPLDSGNWRDRVNTIRN
jgi:septin family protein